MIDGHLVQMANRIGEFFESWPDRDEALEGIATHLCRYWEPRMRRQLLALVDEKGQDDLAPMVREALSIHREMITPGH